MHVSYNILSLVSCLTTTRSLRKGSKAFQAFVHVVMAYLVTLKLSEDSNNKASNTQPTQIFNCVVTNNLLECWF